MRAPLLLAVFAVAAGHGDCSPRDPAWDPCAGLACGESCRPCPPDETCETFAATACDAEGQCVTAGTFDCDEPQPYAPCEGKACGEGCTLCAPWDGDCVETAVLKACDPAGECSTDGSFTCPPPPGG